MFAYSYRWEEETLYYPEYDALHRRIEDAGLEFEDKSGVPMLVVIQTSLKVYGSIFAAFFIAHLIGRRFYPQAYNVLDSVKELRTPLSRNHYGTLSWIWGVFRPSDDELFDHCGMDAVVLIRTIRFGINIYDALHRRIEDAGLEFEDKSGVPMLVVIQTSLKVYGSIFAAFFIAHLIGRRFYPQAYNVLDSVKELRTPLSRNHYGTLSWIWGVFRPSDDELFDHCGMDAVVLIRTIRFGINIALVSLSCSLARSCSICLR